MENVKAQPYRIAATRVISAPRTAPRTVGKRPLADSLEWVAMIILPLSSLVAAVSLLGHAVR